MVCQAHTFIIEHEYGKGCLQGSNCGPLYLNLIANAALRIALEEDGVLQAYADGSMLLVEGRNTQKWSFWSSLHLASLLRYWLTFWPSERETFHNFLTLRRVRKLAKYLKRLAKWSKDQKLHFCMDKTVLVYFRNQKQIGKPWLGIHRLWLNSFSSLWSVTHL